MKLIVYIILGIIILIGCSKLISGQKIVEKLNSQGLIYLNEGKFEKALIKFKEEFEKEEGDWEKRVMHLRNISLAYEGMDENELALRTKKQALNLCPKDSYDYFVTRGDIDLIENNIEKAISNFKKAIEINPDKLEANNSLGLVYVGDYGKEFRNLKQALIYNKQAVKVYPYSITKNVLGRNYFLMKEYKMADKYFTEILEEYPDDIDTKYSLGIIKFELEDFEQAKKLLEEVMRLNPEYLIGHDNILNDLQIKTNR